MNSTSKASAYLSDAEIILNECTYSYEKGHWHRVMRKCQEASELAVMALFIFFGIDYPKAHIFGRVLRKQLKSFNVFTEDDLQKMANICDTLALDREPSFYGAPDGTPAASLFDRDDASEARENVKWIIGKTASVINQRY